MKFTAHHIWPETWRHRLGTTETGRTPACKFINMVNDCKSLATVPFQEMARTCVHWIESTQVRKLKLCKALHGELEGRVNES